MIKAYVYFSFLQSVGWIIATLCLIEHHCKLMQSAKRNICILKLSSFGDISSQKAFVRFGHVVRQMVDTLRSVQLN